MAKADPVVGRWSAVRARMQGRGGNHEVPADVWHALVYLADQADPGVCTDIRALASGRSAPDGRSYWSQEGAPLFLVDPDVARQLGAPLVDYGFAAPRLHWHTLLIIQDAGYYL